MIETWKSIKGYGGVYKISNKGIIKRTIPSRYATARDIGFNSCNGASKFDYRFVVLSRNDVHTKHAVHRLVAEYFIGRPPKDKYGINHKDGDTLNNIVSNLEYCSQKENVLHAIKSGLRRPGGNYKLTDKEIGLVKKEYKAGGITQAELGRKYKVCQVSISRILKI